jgi:hypothetical protein
MKTLRNTALFSSLRATAREFHPMLRAQYQPYNKRKNFVK